MPSDAFQNFRTNLEDVTALIESHEELNYEGQGRRGLGHITRSGVVMLCAAWEVYNEEVVVECVNFVQEYADEPSDLPLTVQKNLSRKVKNADHELKPLHLAGNGWKEVYIKYTEHDVGRLNTPKHGRINERYERYLGIEDISDAWSIDADEIDDFVTVRGEIAHNGRRANYVQINSLRQYLDEVKMTASETDNFLAEYVKEQYPSYRQPWNRLQDVGDDT
jgi:hypothetical protein